MESVLPPLDFDDTYFITILFLDYKKVESDLLYDRHIVKFETVWVSIK